ncbi:PE family protein [Mycobacterium sp. 852014-50255_SCH5639931]|uniref:PE family protein n=1 Tax=Mycobacterium sp. 852014-50255_SCH5639931 TaxID=1834112 RepID=UPI0009EE9228|nr:PE family protein [Mycobacterium sp. 852014-50255_SCH5639931]
MSFVFATPEYVAAAASDLARIGWTITSANSMALGPTSSVLAPGADEVSTGIATLFDAHSQVYQALSAQAAVFHNQFVQLMNGGAAHYLATEAANTTPLQSAAAPASMAAQLPAVTAAGGSAPGVPAGPLMSAVGPASAIAGAQAPASPTVAAATTGPAAVAPATTSATPVRMVTPAYTPATTQPAAPAPAPVNPLASTPAQVETPQAAAAPAMPVSTGTPVKMVSAHSPAAPTSAESSARPAPALIPKVD